MSSWVSVCGPEPSSPTARNWSVKNFYNQMADTYNITEEYFEKNVQNEWPVLQRVLTNSLGKGALRVLDCACGAGTQLLGAAEYGHLVTGSDFSDAAVRRAEREAVTRGLSVWLTVADMQNLPFDTEVFDTVICADNAIPHLLTRDSMFRAVTEMRRVLVPGGVAVITTLDYDYFRPQQTTGTYPFVLPISEGRAISFQVWNWHSDKEIYDVEHFRLMPNGQEEWRVSRFTTQCWAVSRAQLNEILIEAKMVDLRWFECDESGYHQPILTARG